MTWHKWLILFGFFTFLFGLAFYFSGRSGDQTSNPVAVQQNLSTSDSSREERGKKVSIRVQQISESSGAPVLLRSNSPKANSKSLGLFGQKRNVATETPNPNGAGDDVMAWYRTHNLKWSDPVSLNGRHYLILEARAVPVGEGLEKNSDQILLTQGGFHIMPSREPLQNAEGSGDLIFARQARPVVVNESNGQPAVITGTLVVFLGKGVDAQSIANHYNLKLLEQNPRTGIAYLQVPEGFAIFQGKKRLEETAGVKQVEIEMVGSLRRAL